MIGSQLRSLIFTLLLALALFCLPTTTRAGDRSFIAGFQINDEVRYTLIVRSEETTSVTGAAGIGASSTFTESVGVLIRCKAKTLPMDILDVVYESFKVTIDSPAGRAEIDLGGAAPDAAAPPVARAMYDNLRGIVGTTITLNIAPGSGVITMFHGNDALLKSGGSSILRRYLDKDLFESTFAPIFQLKDNGSAPPPGQKWYVPRHAFAYAHPGKARIWETRVVDGVLADIATVKGSMLANAGADSDSGNKPVDAFTNITGDVTYTWDLIRARLLSAKGNEVVKSRFTRDTILMQSDITSHSTLELVDKKLASSAPEKAPPPPAPATPPTPASPADGKPTP